MTDGYFRILVRNNTLDEKDFSDINEEYLLKLLEKFKPLVYEKVTEYNRLWIPDMHMELQGKKQRVMVKQTEDGNFVRDESGDIPVLIPREKPIANKEFFQKTFDIGDIYNINFEDSTYIIDWTRDFYLVDLPYTDMLLYLFSNFYQGDMKISTSYSRINPDESDENITDKNNYIFYYNIFLENGMP